VRVRLLHAGRLDLPEGVSVAESDHVRALIAGPVTKLEDDGHRAVVEIVDWDFTPTCRHCGGRV